MQSKVKNVQANGTWDGQHGTMYKFEYEFEDGRIVECMHKTSSPRFKPGDDCEYEITGTYNGQHRGKIQRPQTATSSFAGSAKNDPDTVKRINASWAIEQAIRLMGNTVEPNHGDRIIAKALAILDWRDSLMKEMDRATEKPSAPQNDMGATLGDNPLY